MTIAPVCAKAVNVVKKTDIIQAGLIHQDYIPEKHCINEAKNFHLKQCISWVLGD
jgi:hypothetical protein